VSVDVDVEGFDVDFSHPHNSHNDAVLQVTEIQQTIPSKYPGGSGALFRVCVLYLLSWLLSRRLRPVQLCDYSMNNSPNGHPSDRSEGSPTGSLLPLGNPPTPGRRRPGRFVLVLSHMQRKKGGAVVILPYTQSCIRRLRLWFFVHPYTSSCCIRRFRLIILALPFTNS
jgi:hypothetical protein